jgi:hypothetical protein
MVSLVGFVDAATIEFDAPYDGGDYWYGYGGNANDNPVDGCCEIYMFAVGINSEVACWIGSDITFYSTKSVSMDADLSIKGYTGTTWPFGVGILRIYLECRYTSDGSVRWTVLVWSDTRSAGQTHTFNDYEPTLDTGDFPVSTPAGSYHFCVRFDFIGCWGARFQWSSGSATRGKLYVDSITVTY